MDYLLKNSLYISLCEEVQHNHTQIMCVSRKHILFVTRPTFAGLDDPSSSIGGRVLVYTIHTSRSHGNLDFFKFNISKHKLIW